MRTKIRKNHTELIFAFAVVAITFFAFFPMLQNRWTNWDDDRHILKNDSVRSLDFAHLRGMFTQNVNKVFIPLTVLSHAIEYHFFKFNPLYYHLDNLLLHMLVVWLVYQLARNLGLGGWAATVGSLLFAIHPMHVESVAWVTERKDVLYAFFYLLSLHQYLKYLKSNLRWNYLLCVLFCFLSLLSKPMAISLPLVLLLLDWFKQRPFSLRVYLEKLPFFVMAFLIGWITYQDNMRVPGTTLTASLLSWVWSLTFYLHKFFFPDYFIPLYRLPQPVGLGNPAFILAIVGLFFIAGILILGWRSRWLRFAFLFYVLSIFFILRLDNQVDVTFVADRFMYLPSLGFCLAAGFFCESILVLKNFRERTMIFIGMLIAMLIVLFAKTFHQVQFWRDGVSLWSQEIRYAPEEELAYNSRGAVYSQQGRPYQALVDLSVALQLKKNDASRYNNRGLVYNDLKRYDLALKDFNRAIELNPYYAFAYGNRGMIYDRQGKQDLALENYNQALTLDPRYAMGYNNRGILYKNTQHFEAAEADFKKAIELEPDNWQAFYNFGNLYFIQSRFSEAINYYQKTLERNPSFSIARWQLIKSFMNTRQLPNAIEQCSLLIALNPSHAQAYFQRATLYAELNQPVEALEDLEHAQKLGLRIDPQWFGKLNAQLKRVLSTYP